MLVPLRRIEGARSRRDGAMFSRYMGLENFGRKVIVSQGAVNRISATGEPASRVEQGAK